VSTAQISASQTKNGEEHGRCPDLEHLVNFKNFENYKKIKKFKNSKKLKNKKHKKSLNKISSKGQKAKVTNSVAYDCKNQKTVVDLKFRPEKPPKSVVTQTDISDTNYRRGFVDLNKIVLVNQKGESLRKLRSRIETLSKSKSLIQRRCNPLYVLRRYFKRKIIESAYDWELQKISNLLEGGLVFTSHPVGISLSKNIQLVVAPTTPIILRRLVSCLPFWPTSYTMPVLMNIVSLLKRIGARHRSMRL